jgi:hypothetical protein
LNEQCVGGIIAVTRKLSCDSSEFTIAPQFHPAADNQTALRQVGVKQRPQ